MDEVVLENKNRKVVMTLETQDIDFIIIKCYEDDFLQVKITGDVYFFINKSDDEINSSKMAKFINSYLKEGIYHKSIKELLSASREHNIYRDIYIDIHMGYHSDVIIHQARCRSDYDSITFNLGDTKDYVTVVLSDKIRNLSYKEYSIQELFSLYDETTWQVLNKSISSKTEFTGKYVVTYYTLNSKNYIYFPPEWINKLFSYHYLIKVDAFNKGSLITISKEDKIKIAKLKILGQSAKVKHIENDGTVILE